MKLLNKAPATPKEMAKLGSLILGLAHSEPEVTKWTRTISIRDPKGRVKFENGAQVLKKVEEDRCVFEAGDYKVSCKPDPDSIQKLALRLLCAVGKEGLIQFKARTLNNLLKERGLA